MGVRYGLFNHTKKEYVVPEKLPVDAADPTTYPYANFISYQAMGELEVRPTWRVMDDSKDSDCRGCSEPSSRTVPRSCGTSSSWSWDGKFKDLRPV
jgi:hypothetical protein